MRRRVITAVLSALALVLGIQGARAEGAEVRDAVLRSSDEGVILNADFDFELHPKHIEAVSNGVPLYFVIEFELVRSRWYWFAENTVSRRMQLRLSYHPLSRHYRLTTGVLQQSFDSLDAALAVLRRVRNWLVIERGVALADSNYDAAVRLRLDPTLLPKPFQVNALASRDWRIESPWRHFVFRAPQQPPAPVESRDPKAADSR